MNSRTWLAAAALGIVAAATWFGLLPLVRSLQQPTAFPQQAATLPVPTTKVVPASRVEIVSHARGTGRFISARVRHHAHRATPARSGYVARTVTPARAAAPATAPIASSRPAISGSGEPSTRGFASGAGGQGNALDGGSTSTPSTTP
jgi:hypothetical protein